MKKPNHVVSFINVAVRVKRKAHAKIVCGPKIFYNFYTGLCAAMSMPGVYVWK